MVTLRRKKGLHVVLQRDNLRYKPTRLYVDPKCTVDDAIQMLHDHHVPDVWGEHRVGLLGSVDLQHQLDVDQPLFSIPGSSLVTDVIGELDCLVVTPKQEEDNCRHHRNSSMPVLVTVIESFDEEHPPHTYTTLVDAPELNTQHSSKREKLQDRCKHLGRLAKERICHVAARRHDDKTTNQEEQPETKDIRDESKESRDDAEQLSDDNGDDDHEYTTSSSDGTASIPKPDNKKITFANEDQIVSNFSFEEPVEDCSERTSRVYRRAVSCLIDVCSIKLFIF